MTFRFKKQLLIFALTGSLLAASQASLAVDYIYTTITPAGSGGTHVNGALGNGGVFGTYADSNRVYQGFTESNGVYTTITDPNAGSAPLSGGTQVYGSLSNGGGVWDLLRYQRYCSAFHRKQWCLYHYH